jgi:hypothetical protein
LATTIAQAPEGAGASGPAGERNPGGRDPVSRGGDGLRTPARLWVAMTAAVVALLAVGVSCAVTTSGRQDTETRAVNSAEHLVVNVNELYHSLADADATAATSLVVGPVTPTRLLGQYNSDVTQSENALAEASRDLAGDEQASVQLQNVAAQLPTYTALVATAQADNRLGYPVGAAYLREASAFLRGTILPEVKAVADEEVAAQNAAQGSVGGQPWWLLGIVVLAAFVLVRVSGELTRATRRQVNLGLAAGALLMLALVAWALVGTLSARSSSQAAQLHFTAVTADLQNRNELALAESFQSLTLIDRGEDGGADAKGQAAALAQLSKASLDTKSRSGLNALQAQMNAVTGAVSTGDYYKAVDLTVGHGSQTGADTVNAKAATLDTALADLYDADQKSYTAAAGSAGSALSGGLWAGLVVGLLAAAAAAYGINRRLAEYR